MFKSMGLNLGNFLIKKPLRWAFSQAFGSKMKVWFDDNVAIVIDAALSSGIFDPATAIIEFVDGNFADNIISKATEELNIPRQYQGFAREYIKNRIKEKVEETFEIN